MAKTRKTKRSVSKRTQSAQKTVAKKELRKADAALLREQIERLGEYVLPLRFFKEDDGTLHIDVSGGDGPHDSLGWAKYMRAYGSVDRRFGALLGDQVTNAVPESLRPEVSDRVNVASAMMSALGPRDEFEGLLIGQMVAAHNLAMRLMSIAGSDENLIDVSAKAANCANKLFRTFTAQMEALNRHRGKGQQKMVVEHVHVHSGGQAVVGTVSTGGGAEKTEDQCHGKRVSYAPEPEMRRADEKREPVPVARSKR